MAFLLFVYNSPMRRLATDPRRTIPHRSHIPRRRINTLTLFLAAMLVLSACAPSPVATATSLPTLIPAGAITSTALPTDTATAAPASAPTRPQYTLNVVLDYAGKSAVVDETIVYPNHTGQPLNDLLLAVEPNFWQNAFTLQGLSIDDTPVTNYTLDLHKLSFRLATPLIADSIVT